MPSSSSQYKDLLYDGVEFTTQTIKAVSEHPDMDKVLYLSGGVDSRTILAILKAGEVERQFEISSQDPRKAKPGYSQNVFSKDIRIVGQLREALRLDWLTETPKHNVPWTFRECLNAFQSYRSNFSYTFSPSNYKSVHIVPRMTLRGGGGEMLRATNSSVMLSKKIQDRSDSPTASVGEQIENWLLSEASVSSEFDDQIRSVYQEWLNNKGGSSAEETFNTHYLNNRNRTHFGHGRFSASGNEVLFHPLSNAYFLAASQRLPFHERAEGTMVLDIFNMTSPDLLDFSFENSEWNEKLASAKAIPPLSHDSWQTDYDEAAKAPRGDAPITAWWSGRLHEPRSFNVAEAALLYLKNAFSLVEDCVDVGFRPPLHKLHKNLLRNGETGHMSIPKLVAKATSAIDVFLPSITHGARRVISLTPQPHLQSLTWADLQYVLPSLPQDGWHNIPELIMNPSLNKVGAKIVAASGSNNEFEGIYEFAFYLSKDGEKVKTKWYSSQPATEFDNYGSGTYRLESFVRRVGDKEPFSVKRLRKFLSFSEGHRSPHDS